MKQVAICRAHTNIALIKYWGKRDEQLFLPMNSSLSLTLDAFYTDTKVSVADADTFTLNGVMQGDAATAKVFRFVQLFRDELGVHQPLAIDSVNHVPTAAGLASSASAFAALAGALHDVYQLDWSLEHLSTFARRGSGSATRSLFGGFVEWCAGHTSEDSVAVPIDAADWGVSMLVVTISDGEKTISSREGMKRTVATSPFYPAWVKTAQDDLLAMRQAIKAQDLHRVGQIAEHNAMKMHATTLSANPPFTYFLPQTLAVIQFIQQLRTQGACCYVTVDAGPNVKIICPLAEQAQIKQALEAVFPQYTVVSSGVGQGIRQLAPSEWEERFLR